MSETDFLDTAVEAARAAGKVLDHWSQRFSVSEKGRADLVTEADLESQQVIADLIRERFPGHSILGEEGLDENHADATCRWVIDPLDGTSNYVHGLPFYAVSIAVEIDHEPAIGVIFDPTRDEMFTAIRGAGARLNDSPLTTSSDRIDRLDQSLVMASLPVATSGDNPAVERFLTVLSRAQHTQRTGSAALNLAYVACGRIDAFWSTSLKPWDVAAGVVLVAEAGGRVTRIDGGSHDIAVPDILASNGGRLHEELVEVFDG